MMVEAVDRDCGESEGSANVQFQKRVSTRPREETMWRELAASSQSLCSEMYKTKSLLRDLQYSITTPLQPSFLIHVPGWIHG